jgi:hypothetical protein
MMNNKQYMRLDDLPGLGNLPQAENKQGVSGLSEGLIVLLGWCLDKSNMGHAKH